MTLSAAFRPLAPRALTAAALAASALLAQPALAASAAPVAEPGTVFETRSMTVSYNDLDLGTAKGQAAFDARLRRAAGAVCDVATGPHPLAMRAAEQRCFRDALESARASYAMVRQQPVMAR
ncbi:UrcA family protein [Novosphingobium sp. KCTC 2891]|uniref:UrcA family protein n=1 Tax=Novosphingobium sp. KCTC 2891 TaxID=2989730 RepID=UPI0022231DE4|nr:UrcA family protein [Novosphingobium sp. KCTC 2891]MCW1383325.1 UrcA family protein [Novosphingobium sp. KCTC 2891]